MTYEEAMEHDTYVTIREVLRELADHSVDGEEVQLFFSEVEPNHDGLYQSRAVLEWLGY